MQAQAAATVSPATAPPDLDAVRALFREYADSLGVDLEYQGFSAELASLPGAYRPPQGNLFLARVAGAAAGCVALRRIDPRACEMKRLYVRPPYRGQGLGERLLETALAGAGALGYAEVWLDTLPGMAAAHALYLRRGFREIPGYGSAAMPGTRYFGIALG